MPHKVKIADTPLPKKAFALYQRTNPCKGGCGKDILAATATCGEPACYRTHRNQLWRRNWKDRQTEWIIAGRCHACGAVPRRNMKLCVDCAKARAQAKARAIDKKYLRLAARRVATARKEATREKRDRIDQARREHGQPMSAERLMPKLKKVDSHGKPLEAPLEY